MSSQSQYTQPSEIKKPIPRRLFSRTNDSNIVPAPWISSPGSPDRFVESPVQDGPSAAQKDSRRGPFTSSPSSTGFSSPDAINDVGPGAQARWDSIRQHVLAAAGHPSSSSSRPGTPSSTVPLQPPTPSYYNSQPSSASSTSVTFTPRPPSRAQTPKLPGSRLAARLGFKQVVDHARETAFDENRKLREDLFRACWMAKSGDSLSSGGNRARHGDTTTTTGGSSKHLPFTKSTMSSNVTGASSGSGQAGSLGGSNFHSKKSDQRHSSGGGSQSPYGFHSSTSTFNVSGTIASASASAYNIINSASHFPAQPSHNTPSVKYLHQVLWQASVPNNAALRSAHLPHESLVLSALLDPFLSTDGNDAGDTAVAGRLAEERWLAIDAFELVVGTWPPENESASAERCLWCTKACGPLPPSPLRSRLLSTLSNLTNPNENMHVFLSPDTICSIASAVFVLLPTISSLSPQPTLPTQNMQPQQANGDLDDEKILKEVLSNLSTGVLDEEACEDEYTQIRWNPREDDAGVVRQMMISEALARCVQLNTGNDWETRGWLVKHFFKEYWTRLGDKPTLLQGAIAVRRVVHLCNGLLSILSLPPPLQLSAAAPSAVFRAQPDERIIFIQHIVQFIEGVFIPEARVIASLFIDANNKTKAMEVKLSITRLVFELLCHDIGDDVVINMGSRKTSLTGWAVGLVTKWYTREGEQDWQVSFEETLKTFVAQSDWQVMVDRMMRFVTRMAISGDPIAVRKNVIAIIFPHITDRLIQDPPTSSVLASSANSTSPSHTRAVSSQSIPSSSHSRSSSYVTTAQPTSSSTTLTALLNTLSHILPQIFFKPIFSLATSATDAGVVGLAQLVCVVNALSVIVKDWWVRDAEMICIACMSDVGARRDVKGKGKARSESGGGGNVRAGTGMGGGSEKRLGQMIVLVELVERLRVLRRLRDSNAGGSGGSTQVINTALGGEAARLNLSKFVNGLETRFSVLVETMEAKAPLPLVQRLLFITLFREIRLLTRSLKQASWLPMVLRWIDEYCADEEGLQVEEMENAVKEMKEVYELAKGTVGNLNKRRTVVMMPTNANDKGTIEAGGETLNLPGKLDSTLKFLTSLAKGFLPRAIKLLVTVSAMLTSSDWDQVAPLIWRYGLFLDGTYDALGVSGEEGRKAKAVLPLVCFLVMQCAEKNPYKFRVMVEFDLRSSDDLTRLESVHKLSLLVNWRFQVMSESHNILVDRTHRPFKLARAPLPFVPADMGSPNYTHGDTASSSAILNAPGAQHGASGRPSRTTKASNITKDVIPVELKRQLVEIGWVDDDVQPDEKEMWIWTPVSMLPVSQVDKLDFQRSDHHNQHLHRSNHSLSGPMSPGLNSPASNGGPLTPLLTPSAGGKLEESELLRRNSSSGGPTYAKRRAVFVPPLSLVFRALATMVFDPNFAVAAASRDLLLDLMRNDPGLLLRPILDLLCDEQGQGYEDSTQKDVPQAVGILTALMHTRHMIPPPMAHATFNNLAGFLKYALRQVDPSSLPTKSLSNVENPRAALMSFALILPIMTKFAMYVGDLTIREIRRSKMEHFLIPYGTLWFNHGGVPAGPMFPRGLDLLGVTPQMEGEQRRKVINPFETPIPPGQQTDASELDSRLVNVMMIRIAQNFMFMDMLKKSPQDVVLVRKTMPRFVVPKLDGSIVSEDSRKLELKDFVPFKGSQERVESYQEDYAQKTLNVLSLTLARSYVMLVAQVFRCMSRNSNDREEMTNFVDGLNRILLVHGDDIGIVAHVLIAFMVASTRFRRLFVSGGGYALFIPALVKIYAEFHQRVDVKLAIEYAVYRFYTLHREAFLFQALDAIAYVAAFPDIDSTQYASRVYDLFYSLRNGVAPTMLDPAGIHDMNRSQEKEALLFNTAEDKPQTFLSAIRRGDAQTNGQIFFEVPESYDNSRLRMEDLVKLFLTIIAHDPAILRAQHFMHLFRFLAPHLFDASTQARGTLQQGMGPLSEILIKPFTKSKSADSLNTGRSSDPDVTIPGATTGPEQSDKNRNASNPTIMRLDFLNALTAMGQARYPIPLQIVKQAVEISKLILKDASSEMLTSLSTFFDELSKIVILQGNHPNPKIVIPFLQEMVPVIRSYNWVLDFTPFFGTVAQVSSAFAQLHDTVFAHLVIHEVCILGLEISESADVGPRNPRIYPTLVTLIAESVFLRGSDIIGVLEKWKPSFPFLSRVVLPLTLILKTSHQLASESGKSEEWHRVALTSAWVRLLFYAMTACQRSFRAAEDLPLSRAKSRNKKDGEEKQWEAHLPTFATALQIIKVITIRAEDEISFTFPDAWHRLAAFLKSVLMDGNASFALHGRDPKEHSSLPSPSPSPRMTSGQLHSFFDLPGHSTMDSSVPVAAQPRVIDYALWSLLEFLCAYRSPLRLQLRLFTVEKVVSLDQELKHQQRRTSPFASPNPSPMSRRISTSVFAKPRRSGMFPSPDSSPRASRSPSMMNELSIPSIHLGSGLGRIGSLEIPSSSSGGELRIPGYQYSSPTLSPSTPRQGGVPYIQVDGDMPRIIHLGPASPSALIPPSPLSASGGGSMGVSNIRLMAQSTKIKSSMLIKATYRRIRTVQTLMGYDTLLPMPSLNVGLGIVRLEAEAEQVSIKAWTKRSAIDNVLKEMKHLEEEFEESLQNAGDTSRVEMDVNTSIDRGSVLPQHLTN